MAFNRFPQEIQQILKSYQSDYWFYLYAIKSFLEILRQEKLCGSDPSDGLHEIPTKVATIEE